MTRGRCSVARDGVGLIEMMLALSLLLVAIVLLGRIMLIGMAAWERGRDKTVLQANATEAVERMARQIRSGAAVSLTGAPEVAVLDRSGAEIARFARVEVDGRWKLREEIGDRDVTGRECTAFAAATDDDTTSITLTVEFADDSGNQVAATVRAAVRNRHFVF